MCADYWRDKSARESFEISGFLDAYARLNRGAALEVLEKRAKPDYVVGSRAGSQRFGVELTSVYLDDRSVPEEHMQAQGNVLTPIDFSEARLQAYQDRLVAAIESKTRKARAGYDPSRPLILSIYVNEYIAIYLGRKELEALVQRNRSTFDGMSPFAEIVFWNIGGNDVFSVRPE